jgi:outer membrane cobalamin receptor
MRNHGLNVWVCIAGTSALMACAAGGLHKSDETSGGTVTITREQIERSAATNAWELLKNDVRRYTYQEDRSGRPLRIVAQRGVSSIVLADSDAPMIIIDGARLTEISALAQLSSGAISSIEVLSGIRGSGSQGTNASAGVIYIHTREASSP